MAIRFVLDGQAVPETAALSRGGVGDTYRILSKLGGVYLAQRSRLELAHLIRETVPPVQIALRARRRLEGSVQFVSEDEAVQQDVRDFLAEFPYGNFDGVRPAVGFNGYLDSMSSLADEYGFAFSEDRLQGFRYDGVLVPDPRTFTHRMRLVGEGRRRERRYEVVQLVEGRLGEPLEESPRLHRISFSDQLASGTGMEGAQWPLPMIQGCQFVAEVYARIMLGAHDGLWLIGSNLFVMDKDQGAAMYQDAKSLEALAGEKGKAGASDRNTEIMGELAQIDPEYQQFVSTLQQLAEIRAEGNQGNAVVYVQGGRVRKIPVHEMNETILQEMPDVLAATAGQIQGVSDVPPEMFPLLKSGGDGLGSQRSRLNLVQAAKKAEERWARKRRLGMRSVRTYLATQTRSRQASAAARRWDLKRVCQPVVDEEHTEGVRQKAVATDTEAWANAVRIWPESEEGRLMYLKKAAPLLAEVLEKYPVEVTDDTDEE